MGKELRRRHPPEYFSGFAAMSHTEDEVWQIFDEQYMKAAKAGVDYIVCDGQPRMACQVELMMRKYASLMFVLLTTEIETLRERANRRDAGNLEATQLSLKRLDNDFHQMYYVLAEVMKYPELSSRVIVQSTDSPMTPVNLPMIVDTLGTSQVPWEVACSMKMVAMSYD